MLVRLILSSVSVFVASAILPGVHTKNFLYAVVVAVVLALLNAILKPILIILTIPVTVLTLGLFLLVINAFIILLANGLVPGFSVDGFWWALLFSLLVSLLNSVLIGSDKKEHSR